MTHIHNTIKMELLNKIFIICFFVCFIQNSFSQKITGVENIPIYEVCDSTLQNVLDSYIVVTKKCSCCASSWYFQIDLYSASILLKFGEKRTFFELPKTDLNEALCIYKSYYFLIRNHTLDFDDKLFRKTQNTQEITRIENNMGILLDEYGNIIPDEYDDIILDDDDINIYWIIEIQNGEWYKIEEDNTCW